MLSPAAQRYLLNGLQSQPETLIRFYHKGDVVGEWPVDQGYPQFDNRDAANPDRGERVLTWRATLPPHYCLRNAATRVAVCARDGEPLVPSECRVPFLKAEGVPGLIYVNLYLD